MKLYQTLEKQLKTENNFVSDDGILKKWVVINKAQNFDARIIELLLEKPELKETFFLEIKGALVFNQQKFIQFLEQKNYLNDSYTQYKNKVGLTIDGKYLKQRNEVALVWPFKDCVLEGGQSREEDKREEIFFNETLAQDEITQLLEPKILTNAKTYTKEGAQPLEGFTRDAALNLKRGLPKDTITDNLIIKGNNLLALHSLKKEFAGKVKLIYIDPPYNTGNDGFGYNDSFNHSTWMCFMKNRLMVAKELLSESGFLFIQINDIESAYLQILADEIFNRSNFLTSICVKMSHLSGTKMAHKEKKLPKIKEHILMYSKNKSNVTLNPQYVETSWQDAFSRYNSFIVKNGYDDFESEKWEVITVNEAIKQNSIDKSNSKKLNVFLIENASLIFRTARNRSADYSKYPANLISKYVKDENHPQNYHFIYKGEDINFAEEKIRIIEGKRKPTAIVGDIWTDIGINNLSNEGNVTLRFGKKPELLLSRIICLVTNQNDIVLDYHLGSGTTASVAHKVNRQYIGVEQLDYGENDSIKRLQNVIEGEKSGVSKAVNWQGGGSFTYLELKKYNQTFIEQIEAAKNSKQLLKIWEQMKAKSFLNYNVDLKKQDAHIEDFKQLELFQQKQHLVELLDKNQLYVNLSSLKDKDFEVHPEDQKVTTDFYQLNR
jgi:adenine-specific DNA-methyltransferase